MNNAEYMEITTVNGMRFNPRVMVPLTENDCLYARFKTRNDLPITPEDVKDFNKECDKNIKAFIGLRDLFEQIADDLKIPEHDRLFREGFKKPKL